MTRDCSRTFSPSLRKTGSCSRHRRSRLSNRKEGEEEDEEALKEEREEDEDEDEKEEEERHAARVGVGVAGEQEEQAAWTAGGTRCVVPAAGATEHIDQVDSQCFQRTHQLRGGG